MFNNIPQLNRIGAVINQLKSIQNPEEYAKQMMDSNPQFKRFVDDNKGKTPEEIAKSYGIDSSILSLFKR